MNHYSVVFWVNRFTVFSQGNPSLTQVTGEHSDIQTLCGCVYVYYIYMVSTIS